MRKYWQYNKIAYGLFLKHMNRFIGYRLVSTTIVTLLLVPLLTLLSGKLMTLSGFDYVTNNLIGKFLMSPFGLVLVLMSLIFGFFIILLELGGLIVISHQTILGEKESRFIDILRYSIKRYRLLISRDGLIMAIYFIVLAPLLDSSLSTSLLSNIKIPGFIMQSITANDLLSLLLGLSIVLVLYLTFRWMFALHVLMLKEIKNKRFLKESNIIRKGHLKSIMSFFIASILYNLFLLLMVILIFIIIGSILILLFSAVAETMIYILLGLGALLLFVFIIVEVPVSLLSLTLLYHDLSGEKDYLDIHVIEGSTWMNRLLANKFFITISVVIALIIGASTTFVISEGVEEAVYDVDITAHRGSSFEAPENTVSAIKIAYENGADYVEIDVQLTKDHQVILLHDETFERTTGLIKRPDQVNLDELKWLDAGLWFSNDFKGESIPTLEEVMIYSKGKIKLNIEIKGSKYSPEIRQAVVDLINKHDYLNHCVMTSLDYDDIEGVEIIDSRVKTGYVMFVAFGDLEKLHTDFYSIEASNVTHDFVNKAHDIGREVHVWTVNDKDQMKTMMDMGVDNIITDQDKLLRDLLHD